MASSQIDGETCCKPTISKFSPELLKLFNYDEDAILEYQQRKRTVIGQDITDYIVGDIVWAKIWTYPFWPAIVCIDPIDKKFIKGNYNEFVLYVRFLNENGRRSWSKNIEPYCSVQDQLKKYPNLLNTLTLNKQRKIIWDGAVWEADSWIRLDIKCRTRKFAQYYKLDYSTTFVLDDSSKDIATAENEETITIIPIPKPKMVRSKYADPGPNIIKLVVHDNYKN